MLIQLPPPPPATCREPVLTSDALSSEVPEILSIGERFPHVSAMEDSETGVLDLTSTPTWLLDAETGGAVDLTATPTWLLEALQKVAKLGTLDHNWHETDVEAPNAEAVSLANRVLIELADLEIRPSGIDASIEGGIYIAFASNGRRANIECFNSGEMLGAMVVIGQAPIIWEVTPYNLSVSAKRIHSFLNE